MVHTIYIYNFISGNIIELDDEHYNKMDKLINSSNGTSIPDILTEEEIDFLFERNFIIPEEFDEINYLKTVYKTHFNGHTLSLVLEPTLGCNFACIYCFEDTAKPVSMTKDRQDRLLKFAGDYMKEHHLDALSVGWFGGEPLLKIDVIDYLTEGFRKIFEERKLDFKENYRATLVTNGSLMNKNVLEKFDKWNVNAVQVTIDGSRKVHNERRPLKGGKPSFDIVFGNFLGLLEFVDNEDKDIHITLRINFSMDVKDEVTEILDIIPEKYRKYINVTYKHYFPKSSEWGTKSNNNLGCVDYNDISLTEAKLEKIAVKKGYKDDGGKVPLSLKPYYCVSSTIHHYEITPDLKLYKCNVSMGKLFSLHLS